MSMSIEDCAKRLKESMSDGIKKANDDYDNSEDKQKDIDKYEEDIYNKNKEEEMSKTYSGPSYNSKIPKIELSKPNEGIECPHCGHKNCNCNFHKEKQKEEEPEEQEEEINMEELDNLLKENDIDKLKELLDKSPDSPYDNKFLKLFCKEIDDEFQKAESSLSTPSPIPLVAKGTLNFKLKSNFVLNAIEIGVKISAYWSMCIVPMVSVLPQNKGAITLVINDASKIASSIAQKLIQLSKNAKADDYKEFCKIIIDEVKTITWNITEVVPGSPPVTLQYTASVN